MASTVKGSARKGKRLTHNPKSLPKGARSPDSVPGGTSGGGMGKGGENARGNAGNSSLGSL